MWATKSRLAGLISMMAIAAFLVDPVLVVFPLILLIGVLDR